VILKNRRRGGEGGRGRAGERGERNIEKYVYIYTYIERESTERGRLVGCVCMHKLRLQLIRKEEDEEENVPTIHVYAKQARV